MAIVSEAPLEGDSYEIVPIGKRARPLKRGIVYKRGGTKNSSTKNRNRSGPAHAQEKQRPECRLNYIPLYH